MFGGNGPLNNFRGDLKLAYALGWIGQETYHDLHITRQIRNHFAPAHEAITLRVQI